MDNLFPPVVVSIDPVLAALFAMTKPNNPTVGLGGAFASMLVNDSVFSTSKPTTLNPTTPSNSIDEGLEIRVEFLDRLADGRPNELGRTMTMCPSCGLGIQSVGPASTSLSSVRRHMLETHGVDIELR